MTRSEPQSEEPAPSIEELLEHAPFLERLARALEADEHGARDLLQETWLHALRRPPRHGANPRAWLARVLRRTHAHRRARGGRLPMQRPSDAPEPVEARREQIGEAERETIARAVEALDPRSCEVIRLRYFEGLPLVRIAERLGLPESTVDSRLRRALSRLRERLDRELGPRSWGLAPVALAPRGERRPGISSRGLANKARTAAGWSGARVALVTLAASGWMLTAWSGRSEAVELPITEPADASAVVVALPTGEARAAPAARSKVEPREPSAHVPADETAPTRLEVRVLDADGRPVADAVVGSGDAELGATDRTGHLTLELGPENAVDAPGMLSHGRVVLLASGCGARSDVHYVRPDARTVTLELPTNRRAVRGIVREPNGSPVTDARIELERPRPASADGAVIVSALRPTATSDAAGEFELEGVPAGVHAIRVTASGFVPYEVFSPADSSRDLVVTLARGCRVGGVVRDTEGVPVAAARVWSSTPESGRSPDPVRCDGDGRFELDGLEPGPMRLFAVDPARPDLWATESVRVPAGGRGGWDPELSASGACSVVVVDEAGLPQADWIVTVEGGDGSWQFPLLSDASGRIELPFVPEEAFALHARGPRNPFEHLPLVRRSVHVDQPGNEAIRLVVPSAEPRGRLTARLAGPNAGLVAELVVARVEGGLATTRPVDGRDGSIDLSGLPAGQWDVRASCPGHGSFALAGFELEDGALHDAGEVRVPPLAHVAFEPGSDEIDRLAVAHVVRGRAHETRRWYAVPQEPVELLAGEIELTFERAGRVYTERLRIEPGAELRTTLEAP